MSSSWEQVMQYSRLISLPEAFLQLKKVLSKDEYSMAEVALAISHDPALSARLLRLVNSPLYASAVEIDTLFRAVNMMGTRQIYDLALATSVAQTFDKIDCKVIDMPKFWFRSVYCAVAARLLAQACNVLDCERLFVAGLLYDIGHLLMYRGVPELCVQALIEARDTGRALHLVEQQLCHLDYARVGAELMRQWQLPASLRETTEFHIEPQKALRFPLETSIVHIASKLAGEQEMPKAFHPIKPSALQTCGLDIKQVLDIRKAAEMQVQDVVNTLFGLQKTA